MRTPSVRIDYEQCNLLADNLNAFHLLNVVPSPLAISLGRLPEPIRENFLLTLVGICHDTKSLGGFVDEHQLRGWDYLLHKMFHHALENPADFTAEGLEKWTAIRLMKILSGGDSQSSEITNPQERAVLIRDLGS